MWPVWFHVLSLVHLLLVIAELTVAFSLSESEEKPSESLENAGVVISSILTAYTIVYASIYVILLIRGT